MCSADIFFSNINLQYCKDIHLSIIFPALFITGHTMCKLLLKHTSVHIYTQLFLKQDFTCCGHPYLGWIFLFEKLEMTHQSNGSPESLSHTSSCQLVSPPRPCTSQSVSFVKENHFIGCTHSTEMDILTLTLLFIKVKGDRDT